jgi:hypothetical protein
VKTKKLAGAGAVGAAAVAALLLGSTPAFAQESGNDYAFGIEAAGVLAFDALPRVESTDGQLVGDQVAAIGDVLGEHEDAIAFGLLTTEARSGFAQTAVTELNLLDLLRADKVRTWCEDGDGGLEVINGTILGQDIPDTSVPNHEIDLSPIARLTLNDQVRNADGSLTVTGIKLEVVPGGLSNPGEVLSSEERAALPVIGGLLNAPLEATSGTVGDVVDQLSSTLGTQLDLSDTVQTITIGEANCADTGGSTSSGDGDGDNGGGDGDGDNGGGDGDGDNGGDDNGDDSSSVKTAPAPSVVAAALPVTG